MAKNRNKRTRDTEETPKARQRVPLQTSIADSLSDVLQGLDNVMVEASTYLHEKDLRNAKRRRAEPPEPETDDGEADAAKADIYGAMLSQHLQSVCDAVSSLGLQLLPGLHEVNRRLLSLVSSPLLSSAESWETSATVCLYYGVGSVNVLREIVDFILREPGVLLLDCPCVVHPELMEFFLLPSTPKPASAAPEKFISIPQNVEAVVERTERKLRSLRLMLSAAGEALDTPTLQQFAFRFYKEIIHDGLLPLQEDTSEVKLTLGALPSAPKRLQWRIPCEWHGECILLLETLLALMRPVDPDMLRCGTNVVRHVFATAHRGRVLLPTPLLREYGEKPGEVVASSELSASTVAAAVQLRRTMQLLRHPALIPSQSAPERITVEHRHSRVFIPAPVVSAADAVPPTGNTTATTAPPTPTETSRPPPLTLGASLSTVDLSTSNAEEKTPIRPAAPPPKVPLLSSNTADPAAASTEAKKEDEEDLPDIDFG